VFPQSSKPIIFWCTLPCYRLCGCIFFIFCANFWCAVVSTGLCTIWSLAGLFSRQFPFFRFCEGRLGRCVNPPPQFGHTFSSTVSMQLRQKVHSYEQIIASVESAGNEVLQCSQVGLSSSMVTPEFKKDVSGRYHRLLEAGTHLAGIGSSIGVRTHDAADST